MGGHNEAARGPQPHMNQSNQMRTEHNMPQGARPGGSADQARQSGGRWAPRNRRRVANLRSVAVDNPAAVGAPHSVAVGNPAAVDVPHSAADNPRRVRKLRPSLRARLANR